MSANNTADPRPLSPHLQVWRFHATMFASIFQRITGAALYFGSFLIVAWIFALASNIELYNWIQGIIFSIPGQIIMFLWTVAVLFHFANGIRHLLWDGPAMGFDPKTASQMSIFNFVFAFFGAAAIFAAAMYL